MTLFRAPYQRIKFAKMPGKRPIASFLAMVFSFSQAMPLAFAQSYLRPLTTGESGPVQARFRSLPLDLGAGRAGVQQFGAVNLRQFGRRLVGAAESEGRAIAAGQAIEPQLVAYEAGYARRYGRPLPEKERAQFAKDLEAIKAFLSSLVPSGIAAVIIEDEWGNSPLASDGLTNTPAHAAFLLEGTSNPANPRIFIDRRIAAALLNQVGSGRAVLTTYIDHLVADVLRGEHQDGPEETVEATDAAIARVAKEIGQSLAAQRQILETLRAAVIKAAQERLGQTLQTVRHKLDLGHLTSEVFGGKLVDPQALSAAIDRELASQVSAGIIESAAAQVTADGKAIAVEATYRASQPDFAIDRLLVGAASRAVDLLREEGAVVHLSDGSTVSIDVFTGAWTKLQVLFRGKPDIYQIARAKALDPSYQLTAAEVKALEDAQLVDGNHLWLAGIEAVLRLSQIQGEGVNRQLVSPVSGTSDSLGRQAELQAAARPREKGTVRFEGDTAWNFSRLTERFIASPKEKTGQVLRPANEAEAAALNNLVLLGIAVSASGGFLLSPRITAILGKFTDDNYSRETLQPLVAVLNTIKEKLKPESRASSALKEDVDAAIADIQSQLRAEQAYRAVIERLKGTFTSPSFTDFLKRPGIEQVLRDFFFKPGMTVEQAVDALHQLQPQNGEGGIYIAVLNRARSSREQGKVARRLRLPPSDSMDANDRLSGTFAPKLIGFGSATGDLVVTDQDIYDWTGAPPGTNWLERYGMYSRRVLSPERSIDSLVVDAVISLIIGQVASWSGERLLSAESSGIPRAVLEDAARATGAARLAILRTVFSGLQKQFPDAKDPDDALARVFGKTILANVTALRVSTSTKLSGSPPVQNIYAKALKPYGWISGTPAAGGSNVCAGCGFALHDAIGELKASDGDVLMVVVDVYSRINNFRKHDTLVFGDMASAMLLGHADSQATIAGLEVRFSPYVARWSGDDATDFIVSGVDEEGYPHFEMNPQVVGLLTQRYAGQDSTVMNVIKEALRRQGLTLDDVDAFALHQGQRAMQSQLAGQIENAEVVDIDAGGLADVKDPSKKIVAWASGDTANGAAASSPVTLHKLLSAVDKTTKKRLINPKKGKPAVILMVGFGGGPSIYVSVVVAQQPGEPWSIQQTAINDGVLNSARQSAHRGELLDVHSPALRGESVDLLKSVPGTVSPVAIFANAATASRDSYGPVPDHVQRANRIQGLARRGERLDEVPVDPATGKPYTPYSYKKVLLAGFGNQGADRAIDISEMTENEVIYVATKTPRTPERIAEEIAGLRKRYPKEKVDRLEPKIRWILESDLEQALRDNPDIELVFEAVPDNETDKTNLLATIWGVRANISIVSNTSFLNPVIFATGAAEKVARQKRKNIGQFVESQVSRVITVHDHASDRGKPRQNPVVNISDIRGRDIDPRLYASAKAYVESTGQIIDFTNDMRPGFAGNRLVFGGLVKEMFRLRKEGYAMESIVKAMTERSWLGKSRYAVSLPPIGFDADKMVREIVTERVTDDILRSYYHYYGQGRGESEPVLSAEARAAAVTKPDSELTAEEHFALRERLWLSLMAEYFRLIEDNTLRHARWGDFELVAGFGLEITTGGVLQLADDLGVSAVGVRLNELAAEDNHFAPAEFFRKIVADGSSIEQAIGWPEDVANLGATGKPLSFAQAVQADPSRFANRQLPPGANRYISPELSGAGAAEQGSVTTLGGDAAVIYTPVVVSARVGEILDRFVNDAYGHPEYEHRQEIIDVMVSLMQQRVDLIDIVEKLDYYFKPVSSGERQIYQWRLAYSGAIEALVRLRDDVRIRGERGMVKGSVDWARLTRAMQEQLQLLFQVQAQRYGGRADQLQRMARIERFEAIRAILQERAPQLLFTFDQLRPQFEGSNDAAQLREAISRLPVTPETRALFALAVAVVRTPEQWRILIGGVSSLASHANEPPQQLFDTARSLFEDQAPDLVPSWDVLRQYVGERDEEKIHDAIDQLPIPRLAMPVLRLAFSFVYDAGERGAAGVSPLTPAQWQRINDELRWDSLRFAMTPEQARERFDDMARKAPAEADNPTLRTFDMQVGLIVNSPSDKTIVFDAATPQRTLFIGEQELTREGRILPITIRTGRDATPQKVTIGKSSLIHRLATKLATRIVSNEEVERSPDKMSVWEQWVETLETLIKYDRAIGIAQVLGLMGFKDELPIELPLTENQWQLLGMQPPTTLGELKRREPPSAKAEGGTATLMNGFVGDESEFIKWYRLLQDIIGQDPTQFDQVVLHTLVRDHQLIPGIFSGLRHRDLVDKDGSVPEVIRQVILASVMGVKGTGENLDLSEVFLAYPVKNELSDAIHYLATDTPQARQDAARQIAAAGEALADAVQKNPVIARNTLRISSAIAPKEGHASVAAAGIAVMPQHFDSIRQAWGDPELSQVPVGVGVDEIELEVPMPDGSHRILDILRDTPDSKARTITKHLASFGESLQQIELWTSDIVRAAEEITQASQDKASGLRAIDKAPRPGAGGTIVFFVLVTTEEGKKVLLELIQRPKAGIDAVVGGEPGMVGSVIFFREKDQMVNVGSGGDKLQLRVDNADIEAQTATFSVLRSESPVATFTVGQTARKWTSKQPLLVKGRDGQNYPFVVLFERVNDMGRRGSVRFTIEADERVKLLRSELQEFGAVPGFEDSLLDLDDQLMLASRMRTIGRDPEKNPQLIAPIVGFFLISPRTQSQRDALVNVLTDAGVDAPSAKNLAQDIFISRAPRMVPEAGVPAPETAVESTGPSTYPVELHAQLAKILDPFSLADLLDPQEPAIIRGMAVDYVQGRITISSFRSNLEARLSKAKRRNVPLSELERKTIADGIVESVEAGAVREAARATLNRFIASVYSNQGNGASRSAAARQQAIAGEALALKDSLDYIDGRRDLQGLRAVFSIGEPKHFGIFFPNPDGEEAARWQVAADRAIVSLIRIKNGPAAADSASPEVIEQRVAEIIGRFAARVYSNIASQKRLNEARAKALSAQSPALQDALAYVRNGRGLDALTAIFSTSIPKYYGEFFPSPNDEEARFWPGASNQAIEALVKLKQAVEAGAVQAIRVIELDGSEASVDAEQIVQVPAAMAASEVVKLFQGDTTGKRLAVQHVEGGLFAVALPSEILDRGNRAALIPAASTEGGAVSLTEAQSEAVSKAFSLSRWSLVAARGHASEDANAERDYASKAATVLRMALLTGSSPHRFALLVSVGDGSRGIISVNGTPGALFEQLPFNFNDPEVPKHLTTLTVETGEDRNPVRLTIELPQYIETVASQLGQGDSQAVGKIRLAIKQEMAIITAQFLLPIFGPAIEISVAAIPNVRTLGELARQRLPSQTRPETGSVRVGRLAGTQVEEFTRLMQLARTEDPDVRFWLTESRSGGTIRVEGHFGEDLLRALNAFVASLPQPEQIAVVSQGEGGNYSLALRLQPEEFKALRRAAERGSVGYITEIGSRHVSSAQDGTSLDDFLTRWWHEDGSPIVPAFRWYESALHLEVEAGYEIQIIRAGQPASTAPETLDPLRLRSTILHTGDEIIIVLREAGAARKVTVTRQTTGWVLTFKPADTVYFDRGEGRYAVAEVIGTDPFQEKLHIRITDDSRLNDAERKTYSAGTEHDIDASDAVHSLDNLQPTIPQLRATQNPQPARPVEVEVSRKTGGWALTFKPGENVMIDLTSGIYVPAEVLGINISQNELYLRVVGSSANLPADQQKLYAPDSRHTIHASKVIHTVLAPEPEADSGSVRLLSHAAVQDLIERLSQQKGTPLTLDSVTENLRGLRWDPRWELDQTLTSGLSQPQELQLLAEAVFSRVKQERGVVQTVSVMAGRGTTVGLFWLLARSYAQNEPLAEFGSKPLSDKARQALSQRRMLTVDSAKKAAGLAEESLARASDSAIAEGFQNLVQLGLAEHVNGTGTDGFVLTDAAKLAVSWFPMPEALLPLVDVLDHGRTGLFSDSDLTALRPQVEAALTLVQVSRQVVAESHKVVRRIEDVPDMPGYSRLNAAQRQVVDAVSPRWEVRELVARWFFHKEIDNRQAALVAKALRVDINLIDIKRNLEQEHGSVTETTGQYIKRHRHAKMLTQEELASQSKVTVSAVFRIENDHMLPHLLTARALGEALEFNGDEFYEQVVKPERQARKDSVKVARKASQSRRVGARVRAKTTSQERETPGQFIRQYRKRVGLTQEELAHKIGSTVSSVNRYENDHSFPYRRTADALAKPLGFEKDVFWRELVARRGERGAANGAAGRLPGSYLDQWANLSRAVRGLRGSVTTIVRSTTLQNRVLEIELAGLNDEQVLTLRVLVQQAKAFPGISVAIPTSGTVRMSGLTPLEAAHLQLAISRERGAVAVAVAVAQGDTIVFTVTSGEDQKRIEESIRHRLQMGDGKLAEAFWLNPAGAAELQSGWRLVTRSGNSGAPVGERIFTTNNQLDGMVFRKGEIVTLSRSEQGTVQVPDDAPLSPAEREEGSALNNQKAKYQAEGLKVVELGNGTGQLSDTRQVPGEAWIFAGSVSSRVWRQGNRVYFRRPTEELTPGEVFRIGRTAGDYTQASDDLLSGQHLELTVVSLDDGGRFTLRVDDVGNERMGTKNGTLLAFKEAGSMVLSRTEHGAVAAFMIDKKLDGTYISDLLMLPVFDPYVTVEQTRPVSSKIGKASLKDIYALRIIRGGFVIWEPRGTTLLRSGDHVEIVDAAEAPQEIFYRMDDLTKMERSLWERLGASVDVRIQQGTVISPSAVARVSYQPRPAREQRPSIIIDVMPLPGGVEPARVLEAVANSTVVPSVEFRNQTSQDIRERFRQAVASIRSRESGLVNVADKNALSKQPYSAQIKALGVTAANPRGLKQAVFAGPGEIKRPTVSFSQLPLTATNWVGFSDELLMATPKSAIELQRVQDELERLRKESAGDVPLRFFMIVSGTTNAVEAEKEAGRILASISPASQGLADLVRGKLDAVLPGDAGQMNAAIGKLEALGPNSRVVGLVGLSRDWADAFRARTANPNQVTTIIFNRGADGSVALQKAVQGSALAGGERAPYIDLFSPEVQDPEQARIDQEFEEKMQALKAASIKG